MCGICGIVKFNNSAPGKGYIQIMMKGMKHRGPDDEGIFIEDNIGFGFVRLSIIDLSPLGHQPMFSDGRVSRRVGIFTSLQQDTGNVEILNQVQDDILRQAQYDSGRYVIVYNGEVYNYIEIREELRAKGYEFKSNADTEVVLNSYIEWGENCLDKFNGMWALAIYDREKKELFCARDRYGIKPFYYYVDEEQFIFASEIPPILSVLKNKPSPNHQIIFDYLVFNRTDQTEQTFFNEIKKLQHGCYVRLKIKDKSKKFEMRKWYDLKERVKNAEGFRNGEEFMDVFSSAVGFRLRSDVPVGICFSGGLDSASLASVLLKNHDKKDLHSFSAIYGKGKQGDESEYINLYRYPNSDKNNTIHNMSFTTPDADTLFKDLHAFVKVHSEPIPSTSPYAQFKVMELAKDHVVVTLDGQGADEELAGYHYFFGLYFKDLFKNLRWFSLFNELFCYLKIHRSIYGLKTFIYFLMPTFLKTITRVGEKGYLKSEFVNAYSKYNTIAGELYNSQSLNEALLDHFEYKLEHLLKWEDRNSMWFSLESRVPFLDHRLVEKTLASSSDMKIKNGMTKYILREAMRGTIPEMIRLRKSKIGFTTPEDEWLSEEKFRVFVFELLNSESFKSRKIIDVEKAKRLYQKYLNKEIQISKEIWKWLNLELWFREFID